MLGVFKVTHEDFAIREIHKTDPDGSVVKFLIRSLIEIRIRSENSPLRTRAGQTETTGHVYS